MFWYEVRTAPVGSVTALMMLVGGSPWMMIGVSASAAGSERSGVPGTLAGAPVVFTAAGGWVETRPKVTKTAMISTPSPSTIIAGRMENPPGVGGRSGSASAGSSSRVSASCNVMARPA